MGLVPLSEGCGVDLNDAVLHQCLGTDELIVAGIVDYVQDTAFAGSVCGQGMRTRQFINLIF